MGEYLFVIGLDIVCVYEYTVPMFAGVVDEIVGLSDVDLVARIGANELERRRLDAEMSEALAVATARSLHGLDGHRTMVAFCRATLNWSTTEAGRRLGLARAVDEMPGLGDAWWDGRIGFVQVSKLSALNANPRVADQLAEFVPQLLDHAEQMPYSDFVSVVDHFVARADEDGAHDDRDAAVEGRTARAVEVGGTLDLRASGGDGLVAAEVISILDRFVDLEFRRDVAARRLEHGDDADGKPLARTDRQRRFDALVAVFRSAATADRVGSPAEPVVNVVIDAGTWGRMLIAAGLSTSTDLDGRPIDPFTGLATDDSDELLDILAGPGAAMCETTNGVRLHPHDVLRAALAGHVRRVVVDSDRVVLDQGRRRRLFTGAARRAAKLLIRRCEHAGCELPADWCDIDHDLAWVDGGRTEQSNGRVLCRSDNTDKHHRKWSTRRAFNGCSYTVRADGTVILPVGARPPRFSDPPDNDGFADDDESPEEYARMTAHIRDRLATATAVDCVVADERRRNAGAA